MNNLELSPSTTDNTSQQFGGDQNWARPMVDMANPNEMHSLSMPSDSQSQSSVLNNGQLVFDNPYGSGATSGWPEPWNHGNGGAPFEGPQGGNGPSAILNGEVNSLAAETGMLENDVSSIGQLSQSTTAPTDSPIPAQTSSSPTAINDPLVTQLAQSGDPTLAGTLVDASTQLSPQGYGQLEQYVGQNYSGSANDNGLMNQALTQAGLNPSDAGALQNVLQTDMPQALTAGDSTQAGMGSDGSSSQTNANFDQQILADFQQIGQQLQQLATEVGELLEGGENSSSGSAGTSPAGGGDSGAGTTTSSGAGTGSDSGSGTTTSSGTGTGSDSGSGPTTSSGTGSDSGSGPTTSSGTGSDSGSGTTTSSGAGSDSGSGTTTSSGAGTGSDSGSGTTTSSGTGSDSGSGTTTSSGAGSDSGSGTTTSSGNGGDSGSGTTTSSGSGSDSGAGSTTPTSASGQFQVENGQIIGPNGQPFVIKGMNVDAPGLSEAMSDASTLANDWGVNEVRVDDSANGIPIMDANGNPNFQELNSIVNTFTSQGMVVQIDGSNPQAGIFTGQSLAAQENFYQQVAAYYKNNPYVWFGTSDEAGGGNGNSPAWLAETTGEVSAIRGTGNTNPIVVDDTDWSNASVDDPSQSGLLQNASTLTSYGNLVGAIHAYTDSESGIEAGASALQQAGYAPFVEEYGEAYYSNGWVDNPSDPPSVIAAAQATGLGVSAYALDPTAGPDDVMNANGTPGSTFGQEVYNYYTGS